MSDNNFTPEEHTEKGPGYTTRIVKSYEDLARLPETETQLGYSQATVEDVLDNCRLPKAGGGKEQ